MTRRRAAAAPLVLVLAALLPGAALAGPPGSWTRVTGVGASDRSSMRPGLARTADGTLHVLWSRHAQLTGEIVHSAISRDARTVTGPDPVFYGPAGVNDSSALVATGAALRAFFGAPWRFEEALGSAVSVDGGRSWSAGPAPVSRGGAEARAVSAATGIAAASGPGGGFFSAWGTSDPAGSGFHIGLSAADPDGVFPGGTLIDPGVGVDSLSGAAYVAANLLDEAGVALYPIAPEGIRFVIPDSAAAQLEHPVHVTGRIGAPGVYVAFTRGRSEFLGSAAVWNVAAHRGRVLGGRGDLDAGLAAAPEGRLWAFWHRDGAVLARRSNPDATRFGRTVSVPVPTRTETVYDLTGNGGAGPLDALLHIERGGRIASWHRRILPGLSLTARAGGPGRVSLRVTDAGEPVAGAKVRVAGSASGKTGASGSVRFRLRTGRYRASAARPGYARASAELRVR